MSAQKKKASKPQELLPLHDLLGPPCLLEDENFDDYVELLSRIRAHINPRDILEEIWIQDVVDHSWQIPRWRRLEAELHEDLAQWNEDPYPDGYFGIVAANLQSVGAQIALHERRRNETLREIAVFRSAFAACLKNSLDQHCLEMAGQRSVQIEAPANLPKAGGDEHYP